mmetsp:Transcript_126447/g.357647  ORF Transcript_126447/g.357647 Transcript_126447/m.357647 type:complete len:222 (+) Transcript_126447:2-667(+)
MILTSLKKRMMRIIRKARKTRSTRKRRRNDRFGAENRPMVMIRMLALVRMSTKSKTFHQKFGLIVAKNFLRSLKPRRMSSNVKITVKKSSMMSNSSAEVEVSAPMWCMFHWTCAPRQMVLMMMQTMMKISKRWSSTIFPEMVGFLEAWTVDFVLKLNGFLSFGMSPEVRVFNFRSNSWRPMLSSRFVVGLFLIAQAMAGCVSDICDICEAFEMPVCLLVGA